MMIMRSSTKELIENVKSHNTRYKVTLIQKNYLGAHRYLVMV
jgi:hypothetical protein